VYGILLTWFAFFGGFVSNIRRRLKTQKEEIEKAHDDIKIEMNNRKRAEIEKDNLIVELKDALDKVKTLSGLLPICASCKKIRDDKGYWNQIEIYIGSHSNAEFSHSICPDCLKKLYPDFIDSKKT
jgi:preprotein translocase subunit YajC